MIKFFRKIRYDLIGNNKTGKYLKYAIGEIILVVIGILIALSINNWNEKRKHNILKNSYIENLKIDLKSDIRNLEKLIKSNDEYEKNGLYLLDYMENKLTTVDTLYLTRTLVQSSIIPSVTITSVTYNDITTSNNITLFEEAEIKRLLDNYYIPNKWNNLFNNRILQTAWYDYRNEIMKYHSPLLYQDFYESVNKNSSINLDDYAKYKIDWNTIKTNLYLKRQVEMILAYRIRIRTLFNAKIKKAKALKAYIEAN